MIKAAALALLCVCAATGTAAADPGIVIHAGSWETRSTLAPPAGQTQPPRELPVHLVCRPVDRTLDAAALAAIKSHPDTVCETPSFTTAGTGATYAIACTVHDVSIHMKGTITTQGPDEFLNHMMTHAEKAGAPPRDIDMTSISRRVGPCQPGEAQSKE